MLTRVSQPTPDVPAVSRWHAILARAQKPRQRFEAVVNDPAVAVLVPQIPPEELYYLVRAVGVADIGDLLPHASVDQIRTCLDLEAWDGDRVSIERLLPWFEALTDLEPRQLGRIARGCDVEFWSFIFGATTMIHERDPDERRDQRWPHPRLETPDGYFVVEFPLAEREWGRVLERFLVALYEADSDLSRNVLLEAHGGLPSELEEASLRWRTARMADLGFADPIEALEVYQYLDAKTLQAATRAPKPPRRSEPASVPAVFAGELSDDTFLGRVLATIDDAAPLNMLMARLIALLNRVLAADRISPSDLDAVGAATARARDTLSLGLEVLAEGDVSRGRTVLLQLGMVDLFRVGFSLSIELRRTAKRLRAAGVDDPDLLPLLPPRPEFPCALDDAPTAGQRPFRTREDLRRVAARLGVLAREHAAGAS
jgi:Family of unknown function (DUF6178)